MATETLPYTPGRTRRPRPAPDQNRPPAPQARKPVSSPRHTRPIGAKAVRTPRAPFLVLLVGLLGGALVSLLVISTTLDEGSYQINRLIQQNDALTRQQEVLQQQVAAASNPAVIAQEAERFGWRPSKNVEFLNPADGTIRVSKSVTAP